MADTSTTHKPEETALNTVADLWNEIGDEFAKLPDAVKARLEEDGVFDPHVMADRMKKIAAYAAI